MIEGLGGSDRALGQRLAVLGEALDLRILPQRFQFPKPGTPSLGFSIPSPKG